MLRPRGNSGPIMDKGGLGFEIQLEQDVRAIGRQCMLKVPSKTLVGYEMPYQRHHALFSSYGKGIHEQTEYM